MNDAGIASSLLKIKRDYSQLPKIIQKIESPKFSIAEAHTAISAKFYSGKIILGLYWLHISDLNFKADSAGIAPYVKKRMTKTADVEAIMEMSRSEISPRNYVALQSCQSTSASVERSFSMLKILLFKIGIFAAKFRKAPCVALQL